MTKKLVELNKTGLLAEYLRVKKDFYNRNVSLFTAKLQSLQHIMPATVSPQDTSLVMATVELLQKNGALIPVKTGKSIGETLQTMDRSTVRGVIITSIKATNEEEIAYSVYLLSPKDEAEAKACLKKKIIELLSMETSLSSLQGILDILVTSIEDQAFDGKMVMGLVSQIVH